MNLREKLVHIYSNEFQKENYDSKMYDEMNKYFSAITGDIILDKMTMAHQHGYLGFHLIEGHWPIRLLEKKVCELFICRDCPFQFKYCDTHQKMSIFINPYKIGLRPVQFSIDENGDKIADFCYE